MQFLAVLPVTTRGPWLFWNWGVQDAGRTNIAITLWPWFCDCDCDFVTLILWLWLPGVLFGRPEDPENPQPPPLCQGLLLLQKVLVNVLLLRKKFSLHFSISASLHLHIFRSQYPQLCLVHKDTKVAHGELQEQAMSLKFVEIGKVMLVWGILKNVSQVAVSNKISGLFMITIYGLCRDQICNIKSTKWVANCQECDLGGAEGGVPARGPGQASLLPPQGSRGRARPLWGRLYWQGAPGRRCVAQVHLDQTDLQVDQGEVWIGEMVICRMFEAMAGNFAHPEEIQLFLNVLNGSLALHAGDSCIIR